MATLKYGKTCMLPPPKTPTRLAMQGTDTALRNLGFDAQFDLDVECKADAITSADMTLDERLQEALGYAKAQRKLLAQPCARVRFKKEMRDDPTIPEPSEEAVAQIASTVSAALSKEWDVRLEDVQVDADMEAEPRTVWCTIDVCRGAWLLAVVESLAAATKDKGGGLERGDPSGIHRAFAQAGAVETLARQVEPVWAVPELVCEATALVCPGSELTELRLAQVLEAVERSRKAYAETWAEIVYEFKDDVEVLCAKPPMSTFGGRLLRCEDGRRRGLREDRLVHGTTQLPQVMADAAVAHAQLKESLGPNTAWAATELNDVFSIPLDDARRRWQSGPGNLAPQGAHHDPGLRGGRPVFERAKARQRPERPQPPLEDVVVSRLNIAFSSTKDVGLAFDNILSQLDVVFVDNGFANPSCLGYRRVAVGVRLHVGPRAHICVLRLQLQALEDVRTGAARQHLKELHAAVLGCGVSKRDLDKVTRTLLSSGLGCTRWQVSRASELSLLGAVESVNDLGPSTTDDEQALAKLLVAELAEQAIAVGVPEGWVSEAAARVR
eukprot:TRINITY_DN70697_c0_g1_i2.p1 TRINITY_DN70697_c0_g1~~TRINITY_DN70697_c0_g1_i2.p1  ORF type:complete len:561 (-),score=130.17 TRINITY_DN70697_c0_g1_i2:26-1687(-)